MIGFYEKFGSTKSPKRALLLRKMSWVSEVILIGGFSAYILVATLHFINPIYGYFWKHEFKALFPLYVPFVDETSAEGFTLLISIQTIEGFVTAVCSGCTEFPFMIAVINIWILIVVFKDNTNELNVILREKRVDMKLATSELHNIFELYNDIWTYVSFVHTILTI